MKPIILTSLRERRGAIIGWSLGIAAYIALNILAYGSLSDQARNLNKALENLPQTARALFGTANGDFLSPVGYLNSKLFYLILPLLFTMLAMSLANHLFAREEREGTIELLLGRPVSRSRLLLSKLIAGLLVLLAVGLAALLVTLACISSVNFDISVLRVVEAMGLTLLLSLLFGAIAWALLGLGRLGRRSGIAIAGFIAFASYLFTSLQGQMTWLKWPAKLLPYNYYDTSGVLNGSADWRNALGLGVAAVIILSVAFIGFRRRDIA